MKRIYIVRHGQTEANKKFIAQGPDEKLSEEGVNQAKAVAMRAAALPLDTLISSPYQRTLDTAEEISKQTGLKIQTCDLFHEILRPSSMLGAHKDSEEYANFLKEEWSNYTNPSWRYEDAENFADITTRAAKAIEFLDSLEGENILVVSHGHFMRLLTAYVIMGGRLEGAEWAKMNLAYFMNNTGITVFEKRDSDRFPWKLICWNDHAHFAE